MPTKQATKSKYAARNKDKVFSEAERAAVVATARERKAASGRSPEEERSEGLKDLRESLAKMPAADRAMGERIHKIVSDAVPARLVVVLFFGIDLDSFRGIGQAVAF